MKLLKAEIDGYRNIDRAAISFSQITALVSESGCGKSNLMSAIAFAARFISAGSRTRHQMMSDASSVPMNRANAGRDFRADFLFLTQSMGTASLVRYGFSFAWIRDGGGCRITGEWLTLKEDRKGQRPERLILRDAGGKALYRARKDGRCSTKINARDDGLVMSTLLLQDGLYFLSLLKELNAFHVYEVHHSDAPGLFPSPVPAPLSAESENGSPGPDEPGSIPRLLCELREKYPGKYGMLTDAFCQLFPDIEGIDARETDLRELHGIKPAAALTFTMKDKVCSAFVTDASLNQPLEVSALPGGAGRVLLMLTAAALADAEGCQLLEIEEPENSIHPRLLRGFLIALSELAGSSGILISNHSPYIAECLSPDAIYIGMRANSGLAVFRGIKRSKVRELFGECRRCGESL